MSWLRGLDEDERRTAIADLKVVRVAPGEMLLVAMALFVATLLVRYRTTGRARA